MDKKLCVYPKCKTIDLQDSQESSSTESPTSGSNLSETASTAVDKRNRKRKKAKTDNIHHGSKNLWKNLTNIFGKSSYTTGFETTSVNLMKDKDKASTFRRLNSFFKHQKSSNNDVKPITNIGVSPIGYQAIVSETNFKPSEENEIAMAVRLPTGSNTENVAVSIELEAPKKDEESAIRDNSDEPEISKCCEEAESKTTFSGILKVDAHSDMLKLTSMPLYIIDSLEQLVFNPAAEMSHRKLIRPSEDMLLSDDEDYAINIDSVKIKDRLDKITELEKGKQPSINSVNRKSSTENDLMDISTDKIRNRRKTKLPFADAIKVLDEILGESEVVRKLSEVTNLNESSNYIHDCLKQAADLKNVLYQASNYIPGGIRNVLYESDEYKIANAIIDNTLHFAEANSNEEAGKMHIKQSPHRSADSCVVDEKITILTDYNKHQNIEESEQSTQRFNVHHDRISENYALLENPLDWPIIKYQTVPIMATTIRDSSTQYSNSNFTTGKEADIQGSLMLTKHGIYNEKYNSQVTSSSQVLLLSPGTQSNLTNKLDQASGSYESSETVMPNSATSTKTAYSSTLLSNSFTDYDNDLKVPLNSPISNSSIKDDYKEIPNILDLSVSNQDMDEISNMPVYYANGNKNSKNNQHQTNDVLYALPSLNVNETITLEEPSHKFVNNYSTEQELYVTNIDASSKTELQFKPYLDLGSIQKYERKSNDKTLELLKKVRLNLETDLSKTRQVNKTLNQNPSDLSGFFTNHRYLDRRSKKINDVRNVSVCCKNPFNSYEYNKRCYENDDEYYESKRKDVRRYFQNDDQEHDKIERNFNFYLSGDSLNTGVHPLPIINKPHAGCLESETQMKFNESNANTLQNFQTSQTNTLPSTNTSIKYDSPIAKRINSKLDAVLDIQQQMYDNMCSHMKFLHKFDENAASNTSTGIGSQRTIKSRTTENISDELTTNFHELKYNKRCYENDDEYYESRRKNVRRCFQNDDQKHDEMERNFNFYLSGDSLNTGVPPLTIINKPQTGCLKSETQMKCNESNANTLQNFQTSQTNTLPSTNTSIKYDLPIAKSISSKLEAELNTLQQMYDNMYSLMKFLLEFDENAGSNTSTGIGSQSTIKSRTIENISDELTTNFHELKYCLSTITQILAKSTSSLQNISTTIPSAWELFPITSDINNSYNANQTKQVELSNTPRSNDVIIPTTMQQFSTVFGDHSSKENLTNQIEYPSSSKNNNTIKPTAFKSFPGVAYLKNHTPNASEAKQHQSSSISKNIDTIMPTFLEPLSTISDLLGDHLSKTHQPKQMHLSGSTNIYTGLPTTLQACRAVSDMLCDHSSKEQQILSVPRLKSKTIYTVLPTTSESTSTISDALREHSTKENQTKRILPNSSENITSITPITIEPILTISNLIRQHAIVKNRTEHVHSLNSFENNNRITSTAIKLVPTISKLLDDHSLNAIQAKQVLSSSLSENINNIMPTILEPFISDHSKFDERKPFQSTSSVEHIMPTASELFPTVYNLFWDYSPESSQTKLTHFKSSLKNVEVVAPASSHPLLTAFGLVCDSSAKETDSTLDQKSCISSSERSEPYFVMESEIEDTIKELLKESEDIKQTVILKTGKQESELPLFVECINILTEYDPVVICKKIMEDVISSSIGHEEFNKKSNDECRRSREDVKQILDALLKEIDRTENLLDNPQSIKVNKSKQSFAEVNFLCDTSYKEPDGKPTNMQIGDSNNKPSSSKSSNINKDGFVGFCSTATFTPKILKTSFSFGETPSTCLETLHSNYKTPVRRRDGLTITCQENLTSEIETSRHSRLINEILNLQSNMNGYGEDLNEENSNSSSEEKFSSAHAIVEEFQEDATVDDMLEHFISDENNDTPLQEVTPYKLTHKMQITAYKNSVATSLMEGENANNAENSDSEDNSPKPSPKNEDKSAHQTVSTQGSNYTIPKSQKCLQLTNSINKDIPKNQPTTSKKLPKYTATTEEEEIIQNVDLTQKPCDSTTELEYFVPEKASGFTQKSSHSHAQCSRAYISTSEEEIVSHAIRKPRSKKKKNKQIVEIKPKTSVISDSDSEQFAKTMQPTMNSDQSLMSLNSRIVLKSTQAVVNLQKRMTTTAANSNSGKSKILSKAIGMSEPSSGNASDTEYESNHETLQDNLPNPKHRFKSIHELNTLEEIARIEYNIKENDKLERARKVVLVASESSSQLEFENSSFHSANCLRSEVPVNSKQEDGGQHNIVVVDNVGEASISQSFVPPTVESSTSRSTNTS